MTYLVVDGVGAGVGVDDGEDVFGVEGTILGDLPLPEDVIDPAVVEEEDGVERGGVL